jgi:hypothetical protein
MSATALEVLTERRTRSLKVAAAHLGVGSVLWERPTGVRGKLVPHVGHAGHPHVAM